MKRYLLLFIIFLFPFYVDASTNKLDRNSLENFGVNKHFEITDNNRQNVMDAYAVNADEKVYDYADILNEEEEKNLYNKINDFIEKYKTDVVFVSIDLPYSYDKVNEDWAADFYDYNDFGLHFDNYSGIVLLRNVYVDDPYYNVYMFGDCQLYINFDRSEEMLDYIYDDFHGGNYMAGLDKFMDSLNRYYKAGIPSSMKDYYIDEMGRLSRRYSVPWLGIGIIDFIIVLITNLIIKSNYKLVKQKLDTSNYLDKESIKLRKSEDRFVRTYTTSHVRSSSSSSGGGGHSSIGSSGGGHSSGGGRHG